MLSEDILAVDVTKWVSVYPATAQSFAYVSSSFLFDLKSTFSTKKCTWRGKHPLLSIWSVLTLPKHFLSHSSTQKQMRSWIKLSYNETLRSTHLVVHHGTDFLLSRTSTKFEMIKRLSYRSLIRGVCAQCRAINALHDSVVIFNTLSKLTMLGAYLGRWETQNQSCFDNLPIRTSTWSNKYVLWSLVSPDIELLPCQPNTLPTVRLRYTGCRAILRCYHED